MAGATYHLIDHTADVGIEVRAPDLRELFATAAYAMFDIQVDVKAVRPLETATTEATADDLVGLLVSWLGELQFQFEVSKLVFSEFDVQEVTDSRVRAACRGERYDRARHDSRTLIKAVTYHQASVEKTADGWFARLFFDV